MKLTQKGFTIIEGLLILVLLGIIGFAGYRVYTVKQDINSNLQKSDDSSSQTIKNEYYKYDPNNDPSSNQPIPADWLTYTNNEFGFSFKYPEKWGELDINYVDKSKDEYPESKGKIISIKSALIKDDNAIYITVETRDYESFPVKGGPTIGYNKGWYEHGESFYGFRGENKDKADPIIPSAVYVEGLDALYYINDNLGEGADYEDIYAFLLNYSVGGIEIATYGRNQSNLSLMRQLVSTVEIK